MDDDIDPGLAPSRTARQTGARELPTPKLDFPADERVTIKDDAEYEGLTPGQRFTDPEGIERQKPWRVTGDDDYGRVPEGEHFMDPEGNVRQKPVYEGLDFTTQTLYDMALTDKERENALARSFDRKEIKRDQATGEMYVDRDGKRHQAGKGPGVKRAAAGITSQAAPIGGSIAGEIGGFAVANVPGAIIGAGGGGMIGQGFNDMILALTGVYDRSTEQELMNLGMNAVLPAGGSAAARGVVAGVDASKRAVGAAKDVAGRRVASFLGADVNPAATEQAAELAAKGVRVPPSAWAMEAPYLQRIVEELDPAFRTQNVLEQSATEHYGKEAGRILGDLGVPDEQTLNVTAATSRPSSKEAGDAMISKVSSEMKSQNDALATAEANAKAAAQNTADQTMAGRNDAIEALTEAAEANKNAAQKVVDTGLKQIADEVAAAVKDIKVGNGKSGDLWRMAADKVWWLKRAFTDRASALYKAADTAAGDNLPAVEGISTAAKGMLEELPQAVRDRAPDLVKALEKLGASEGAPTAGGKLADEAAAYMAAKEGAEEAAEPVTFGQLRQLRSMLREAGGYGLTSNMREGAMKHLSNIVDNALTDAAKNPGLAPAIKMLDRADAFYARNIKKFNDSVVDGVVKGVEAGMPADPTVLAGLILQPGQTERIAGIRKVLGKGLWGAVQAADTQSMLNAAKTIVPGELDATVFAKEVLDRVQSGVLTAGYDKATAETLRKQAENIMAMGGKLPIVAREGDTVMSFLNRAQQAAKAAEDLAAHDPLSALKQSLTDIRKEFGAQKAAIGDARKADPLAFLGQPSALGEKAADNILKSPDLIMAAANKFGHQSDEFAMLRQVAARRLFERTPDKVGKLGADMAKWSPEVQAVLFPGLTLADAQTLAKEMTFLMPVATSPGGSMAAMSKVYHPLGELQSGDLKSLLSNIPGANALMRGALTQYYKIIANASTNPAFIQWVAKGLRGAPAERQIVRTEFLNRMGNIGGPAMAGVGSYLGQNAEDLLPDEGPTVAPPRRNWREQAGAPGKQSAVSPAGRWPQFAAEQGGPEMYQMFLDHVSARGFSAAEALVRATQQDPTGGMAEYEGDGGLEQLRKDIENYKDVFGEKRFLEEVEATRHNMTHEALTKLNAGRGRPRDFR